MMGNLTDSSQQAEHCAEVLKAVAHPLRLRIVALLCEEPHHVGALVKALEVSQPTVSQQLRILRMADLVTSERSGGLSIYSLAEPGLVDLVQCVERCGARRAARHRTGFEHEDREVTS